MPQNKIQFQHGMSLSEFIECYGTQALCETALEQARWPDGFVCPECGERAHSRFLADGRQYIGLAEWLTIPPGVAISRIVMR